MLLRRWMWIAWPAFLAAGVMEMLVFAVVDPLELQWLAAYTEVVTAQASALSAQRSLLALQWQHQQASVALVEALGGGWQGFQGEAEAPL